MTNCRNAPDALECILRELVLEQYPQEIRSKQAQIFQLLGDHNRDPNFDVLYPPGKTWYISSGTEEIKRLGTKQIILGGYACPAGWMRLGVRLEEQLEVRNVHIDDAMKWHQGYHGTAAQNVLKIMQQGLVRGDGRHGQAGMDTARETGVIYATPSIEMAAHWLYTGSGPEDYPVTQEETVEGQNMMAVDMDNNPFVLIETEDFRQGAQRGTSHVQYVFQVRVRPGSFRVQSNTLASELWPGRPGDKRRLPFDPLVSDSVIEWIVSFSKDILITGVMIRYVSTNLPDFNNYRIRQMLELVHRGPIVDRQTFKMTPRTTVGILRSQPAGWQYNGVHASGSTLSYADHMPWVAFDTMRSNLIEEGFQNYQRYVFLGTPAGADAPYVIDFQNLNDESIEGGAEQIRADNDREHNWRRRAVRRVAI